MTRKEAGSKGGRATVARHGPQHMREIGKRGAAVTWERYQPLPRWSVRLGHVLPGNR